MKRDRILNSVMGMIVLLAISCIVFTSCRNAARSWLNVDSVTTVDSTVVAQQIDAVVNPSFISVEDVLTYRDTVIEDASIDSIFMNLPEATLKNVAAVVLKQHGSITKRLIVTEYKNNSKVYNNLPEKPIDKPNKDTTIVLTLEELKELTTEQ